MSDTWNGYKVLGFEALDNLHEDVVIIVIVDYEEKEDGDEYAKIAEMPAKFVRQYIKSAINGNLFGDGVDDYNILRIRLACKIEEYQPDAFKEMLANYIIPDDLLIEYNQFFSNYAD